MRPGGGKAKGNGFEGTVAKKLSEALSPLKFIRTQSSGARVGGKNFETLGQMFGADALKLFVGDVVPVNEKEAGVEFKHSIECKFYKTQDPFTSLISGTANIFAWMQEAEDDAVKIGRNPLIVFKWNNTPIFVGMSSDPGPQFNFKTIIVNLGTSKSVFIGYLDDLLAVPSFWVDGTLTHKEATNEPQESQSPPPAGPSDGQEGLDQDALDPLRNGQAG